MNCNVMLYSPSLSLFFTLFSPFSCNLFRFICFFYVFAFPLFIPLPLSTNLFFFLSFLSVWFLRLSSSLFIIPSQDHLFLLLLAKLPLSRFHFCHFEQSFLPYSPFTLFFVSSLSLPLHCFSILTLFKFLSFGLLFLSLFLHLSTPPSLNLLVALISFTFSLVFFYIYSPLPSFLYPTLLSLVTSSPHFTSPIPLLLNILSSFIPLSSSLQLPFRVSSMHWRKEIYHPAVFHRPFSLFYVCFSYIIHLSVLF